MKYPSDAVIKSVPAADKLRKVAGFDQLKFLRRTTSQITGEKVLKLDLPYKRLWFRLACPNGRMLVNPLRITDQIAIFEAMVYAEKDDPEPLARFTSSVSAKDALEGSYIQAAQDAALNEALENAGFGIQLCDLIKNESDTSCGSEIPVSKVEKLRNGRITQMQPILVSESDETADPEVDSGVNGRSEVLNQVKMPVPAVSEPLSATSQDELGVDAAESHRMRQEAPEQNGYVDTKNAETALCGDVKAQETEENAPEEADAEQQCSKEPFSSEMSVDEICERMTLEEARSFVVDSGICKGWTMEQVAERRAPSLRFYVCSNQASNVQKAAATLVLNDMERQRAA